jgi:hypothetical protein
MRVYWHPTTKNFGDTITVPILEHLGFRCERADRAEGGKVVATGSIMNVLRPRDVVWGTGVQEDRRYRASTARFLAVRGPLTRACIDGANVPEVYGDPGLLLSEVYNPHVERRHRLGVMPHYMDARRAREIHPGGLFIDVKGGWRRVVRQMKSCDRIITTSLHGIIAADAYGIPVTWAASYSGRIVSTSLKFQDYFLATRGRCLTPGPVPRLEDSRYRALCDGLRRAAAKLPA